MSTDTNIPTPRTNSAEYLTYRSDIFEQMRQLERELAQAKAENEKLRKGSERMRLVFNGLLITTLDTMNRDKIVHEFGELGLSNYKAAKASVGGGER